MTTTRTWELRLKGDGRKGAHHLGGNDRSSPCPGCPTKGGERRQPCFELGKSSLCLLRSSLHHRRVHCVRQADPSPPAQPYVRHEMCSCTRCKVEITEEQPAGTRRARSRCARKGSDELGGIGRDGENFFKIRPKIDVHELFRFLKNSSLAEK